jgi:hypothetical protein
MREPIAAPNTTKYSEVVSTGRQQALHQRARRARHLEFVDRPDAVPVERAVTADVGSALLTRPTKISSSELW